MKNNRLPRRVKHAIAVLQGYCEKHDDCIHCKVGVTTIDGAVRCPLEWHIPADWTPGNWEERHEK